VAITRRRPERSFALSQIAIAMPLADNSVTQWIDALKAGDEAAAAKLWRRYFQRLSNLARKRLGTTPRRAADEEDVALSAFRCFCQGLQEERFPDLRDRDDLWRLVVCITERKALCHMRDQRRRKRGAGLVAGESALFNRQTSIRQGGSKNNSQASGLGAGFDGLAGPEPTPEFAAEMCEAVDHLLSRLADDQLRQIALDKLDGYSNEEIAQRIGRALTTVERRLRLIRKTWLKEIDDA
jgi:DNA-directed RNA polymerase specialized sigma24 family protein